MSCAQQLKFMHLHVVFLRNIHFANQENNDILFVLSSGQSDFSKSSRNSQLRTLRAPQSHP